MMRQLFKPLRECCVYKNTYFLTLVLKLTCLLFQMVIEAVKQSQLILIKMEKMNEKELDFYRKLKCQNLSSEYFYKSWKNQSMMPICAGTFKLLRLADQYQLVQSMRQLANREQNERQKQSIFICRKWLVSMYFQTAALNVLVISCPPHSNSKYPSQQVFNFLRCIKNGGMSGKLFYQIWRNSDTQTIQNLKDSFCMLTVTEMLVLAVKVQELTITEPYKSQKRRILNLTQKLRLLREKEVQRQIWQRKVNKETIKKSTKEQQSNNQSQSKVWFKPLRGIPDFFKYFFSSKSNKSLLSQSEGQRQLLNHQKRS